MNLYFLLHVLLDLAVVCLKYVCVSFWIKIFQNVKFLNFSIIAQCLAKPDQASFLQCYIKGVLVVSSSVMHSMHLPDSMLKSESSRLVTQIIFSIILSIYFSFLILIIIFLLKPNVLSVTGT